jgi:hypothetical protein
MTQTIPTSGTTYIFTPTGKEFTLNKVTLSRVSWYVGFNYKGGNGINNQKMAWVSRKVFEKGVVDGVYVVKSKNR